MTLQEKIEKAKDVISQTLKKYKSEDVAIAWTGGKDSTVVLHLVKDVCGGDIPFPVMFNDSTMEFEEVLEFIKNLTKEWSLNLTTIPHLKDDLKKFHSTEDLEEKKALSRIMKVNAINHALGKYKWRAFLVGIRRDEHEARSKETYFSKRKTHDRIHPILDFTEEDIWKYIRMFNVPYVSLYDKGYRSLGEKPFTKATGKSGKERAGREWDKEQLMKQLRDLGYW